MNLYLLVTFFYFIDDLALGEDITTHEIRSGILPFQLGSARVVQDHFSFFHIFNMETFNECLKMLSAKNAQLETFALNYGVTNYKGYMKALSAESTFYINRIKNKFNDISPLHNNQGSLGSLRKKREVISGTLRHHHIIQHQESNVRIFDKFVFDLIDKVNSQSDSSNDKRRFLRFKVSPNKILQNKINENLQFIMEQDENIEGIISQAESGDEPPKVMNNFLTATNLLMVCGNILLRYLENLENAISYAKRKELHVSVVSHNDLEQMIKTLEEYHPHQAMHFEDSRSYYEVATAQVMVTSRKITFAVTFPLIEEKKVYKLYRLHSVPYKNVSIAPIAPYLAIDELKSFYQSSPCRKIEDTFICLNPIEVSTEDDCMPNYIFKTFNAKKCKRCNYKRHYVKEILIQEISNEYVVVSPDINGMEVTMNCVKKGNIVKYKVPILFKIPPGCSVSIDNYKFINAQGYSPDQAVILPPFVELDLIEIFDDPVMNLTKHDVAKMVDEKTEEILTYFYMITGGFFFAILGVMLYLTAKIEFTSPFIQRNKEYRNIRTFTDPENLKDKLENSRFQDLGGNTRIF